MINAVSPGVTDSPSNVLANAVAVAVVVVVALVLVCCSICLAAAAVHTLHFASILLLVRWFFKARATCVLLKAAAGSRFCKHRVQLKSPADRRQSVFTDWAVAPVLRRREAILYYLKNQVCDTFLDPGA